MKVRFPATRGPLRWAFALLLSGASLMPAAAVAQGDWTTYLNGRKLRAVALDGAGIWTAGTGGATRFPFGASGSPQTLLRETGGLPSNTLTAVHVGPDGIVYFGTQDQGVARWDRARNQWKTLDVTFGLPEDYVTVIRDDGQNIIVGTRKGMAIFAGQDVLAACTSLQDSCLPDLNVQDAIYGVPTRKGAGPYFFATPRGVAGYDGNSWKTLGSSALGSASVTALAQRASDSTLFAASGNNVFALRDTGWTIVASLANEIRSLAFQDETLYIGRDGGVSVLSGSTVTPLVDIQQGQELGQRVSSLEVRGGQVWAGTGNGLWEWNGSSWKDVFKSFDLDQPAFNGYAQVRVDPSGTHSVWFVPISQQQLVAYAPAAAAGRRWQSLLSPPADPVNFGFHALLLDPGGDKYAGHCCVGSLRERGGLERFRLVDPTEADLTRVTWTHYLNPPHNALVVERDPRGHVWVGAGDQGDSLYEFDPVGSSWSGISTQTPRVQLASNVNYALGFRGADGWVGAFGGASGSGLSHWRVSGTDTVWTIYNRQGAPGDAHHIVGDQVRAIAFTGDTVWVGTTSGLALISASRDEVIRNYTAADGSIPSNVVSSIAVGPNGDVWLGIADVGAGGLVRVRGGEFLNYSSRNSLLVDDEVQGLAVDPYKSPYELWVGTGSGISRLRVDLGGGVKPPEQAPTVRFYPHPFRPSAGQKLHLGGPFQTPASVKIFDGRGRTVREFAEVTAGQAFWDGRDSDGKLVGAGLYRARVDADGQIIRKVLAVIR